MRPDPQHVRELYDRILAKARESQALVPGNPVGPSQLSHEEVLAMWAEHRTHVTSAITSQLRPGMRRIAIVGAGRCDSFPLTELLGHCDELSIPQVDLIDINETAMRDALDTARRQNGAAIGEKDGVAELTTSEGTVCRAFPFDITQIMGPLLDRLSEDLLGGLQAAISNGLETGQAMAAIVRSLLDDCIGSKAQILPAPNYDLTVSDSVITQINSFFGVAVSSHWIGLIRNSPPSTMTEMIAAHESILARDHVGTLRQLTKPEGQILLISDVVRQISGQPPRPRFMNCGSSLPKIVTGFIPDVTITGSFGPWTWHRTHSESERVMAVAIQN